MQAVILAGGFGKRVSHTSISLPKPLTDINNSPFLFYLLKQLDTGKISNVLILTGYKSDQIKECINKIKHQFSFKICINATPEHFNTGSRLLNSKATLEKRFLLLYGDNYVPMNIARFLTKYENIQQNVICGYRNIDNYSKSNLSLEVGGKLVSQYGVFKEHEIMEHTDIGYCILNSDDLPEAFGSNVHFGNHILMHLILNRKLYIHSVQQRYYTVGTPERVSAFRDFISQSKYKFIFLDRDGVINKKPKKGSYITKYKDFNFEKNAGKAFKRLEDNNYKVIVITNQAGIARGLITEKQLEQIHLNMCNDVRSFGGSITAIYFCPHHWEEKCECRKPSPGMLKSAAIDFGIDLSKSYFIGDCETDFAAAEAVDCNFMRVSKNQSLYDIVLKLT